MKQETVQRLEIKAGNDSNKTIYLDSNKTIFHSDSLYTPEIILAYLIMRRIVVIFDEMFCFSNDIKTILLFCSSSKEGTGRTEEKKEKSCISTFGKRPGPLFSGSNV